MTAKKADVDCAGCVDHDLIIRMHENIKEIKEDLKECKGLPKDLAKIETKVGFHTKAIMWGGSLLTGAIILLARLAYAAYK